MTRRQKQTQRRSAPHKAQSSQRSRRRSTTRRRAARPAGAWRRFLAALAALAVVLVGVPAVLVVFSRLGLDASHPLPGIGSGDEIKVYFERDLTPTEIAPIAMRALLIAGWLLWLGMALSVLASIFEAQGSGLRSWVPQFAMFAGLSRWIAAGLTAVSSFAPNFVSAASLSSPRPFTINSVTPEQPVVEEAPIAPGFARVQRGESVETFAQRTLGDAGRWTEIWELNKNAEVGPNGEVWSAAWKLGAGWDLRLPADATSPLAQMAPAGARGTRPTVFAAPSPEDVAPAPATAAPAPAAEPSAWELGREVEVVDEYVVAAGDSFWAIAERFLPDGAADRDVWDFTQALMAYNAPRLGYAHPAVIHPGDVVSVVAPPSSTRAAQPETGGVPAHTVVVGDSYWAIAKRNLGNDASKQEVLELTNDLIDLNSPRLGYDDRRMLHPGDVVYLQDPDAAGDEQQESAPDAPAAEPVVDPNVDAIAIDDLLPPSAQTPPTPTTADATTSTTLPPPAPAPPAESSVGGEQSAPSRSPIGIGQAALIATGLVALLVARRHAKLRAAEPPARIPLPSPEMTAAERMLRRLDAPARMLRVDIAVRAAAAELCDGDHRIVAVRCAPDGTVELHLSGPVALSEPWTGSGRQWMLSSGVSMEELSIEARAVGIPCVALIQIGVDDDGWDVLVDLEATGLLTVDADEATANAVVRAVALGLASSEFAEVAHLVGVGIDDDVFLDHRHAHVVDSLDEAVELAATLIGTTATAKRNTFSLRARHTSGEVWEPAVVIVGSANKAEMAPAVAASVFSRGGVAMVVAAPVDGAVWTLRPAGTSWVLDPLGLRLHPVGITEDEVADVVTAIDGVEPEVEPAPLRSPVSVTEPNAGSELLGEPVVVQPTDAESAPDAADDHVVVMDVAASGDLDTVVLPNDLLVSTVPIEPSDPAHHSSDQNGNGDTNGHLAGNGHHAGSGHVESRDQRHGVGLAPPTPAAEFTDPPWSLMVRLLGQVDLVDRQGETAKFERSKTLELLAWLVTHRQRASRAAARTALWDLDVRDATFANVVSEARRAMARHVAPPDGDEWLRRTMTEELSLHDEVIADVDIVKARFDAARSQAPADALRTLRPAVELVREMPFAGTGYLWPDAEGLTSNCVLLATNVTAEFAKLALANRNVDDVFWATGCGLNVLAGQEALIALRMRAHAEAGDLSGVRAEWESYERVINADPWSDGEPAPKLVTLRQELLSR